jgi:predicted MFS family arabinose efflux permease
MNRRPSGSESVGGLSAGDGPAGLAMSPWLRVFLPFAAGYVLSYFLRNVNAVIAPDLRRDLAVSPGDLGLLTGAYLLAFAAAQLPLGVALDRYGARRVESALLLVAAAGCGLFATGASLTQLTLGRGLIGFGVSACLMASFKAFSQWFEAERQPSLNAAIMAAGGLGALGASTPLSLAVPFVGWRMVFVLLALACFAAAAGIWSTPDRATGGEGEPLRRQVIALVGVLRSREFWRFAPLSTLTIGGFMAIQGLWAVPWLMNFSGLDRESAAVHLLLTGTGMLAGFLGIALGLGALGRRGLTAERVLHAGLGLGLSATLLIVLGIGPTDILWWVLGFVFATNNLAYALLQKHFPGALAGRVNTALNLMVFLGAFSIQWGFGAVVEVLQGRGVPVRSAFQASFTLLLALQVAGWLWFSRPEAGAGRTS